MREFHSSHIRWWAYHAPSRTLTVQYGGSRYVYHRVPPSFARRLSKACSAGGFINRYVKPRYPYEREA